MPKKIAGRTMYTVDELARILKTSTRTVGEYVRSGRLRAVKIGRRWHVSEENLQRFLDGEAQGSDERG